MVLFFHSAWKKNHRYINHSHKISHYSISHEKTQLLLIYSQSFLLKPPEGRRIFLKKLVVDEAEEPDEIPQLHMEFPHDEYWKWKGKIIPIHVP